MSADRGYFFSGQKEDPSKLSRKILPQNLPGAPGTSPPSHHYIATLPRKKSIPCRRNPLGQCTTANQL